VRKDLIAMGESIIKRGQTYLSAFHCKEYLHFLSYACVPETWSRHIKSGDAICLKSQIKKGNHRAPLTKPEQQHNYIDANHLKARRKCKASADICRNTLHKSLNETGLHSRGN
jgi:hypothetical protein